MAKPAELFNDKTNTTCKASPLYRRCDSADLRHGGGDLFPVLFQAAGQYQQCGEADDHHGQIPEPEQRRQRPGAVYHQNHPRPPRNHPQHGQYGKRREVYGVPMVMAPYYYSKASDAYFLGWHIRRFIMDYLCLWVDNKFIFRCHSA